MATAFSEKPQAEVMSTTGSTDQHSTDESPRLPQGWRYRRLKIGPIHLPWYASPPAQLLIIAFVCFLCPGMFNALNGIGGGGQINPHAADLANIALYSTFSVVAFFAGSVVNWIGIRASLMFGGLGYCVYISSFLCYTYTGNTAYNIFAGALLGCCAGILWSAQGAIMVGYPPEESKGRYISWFWAIFNLGAVIGSLIPLGQNIHVKTNSVVSTGTYVGFMVLTFLGACLALTLVDSKKVIRSDGSRIILMKNPTWKTELLGLWQTLLTDPFVVLLFPLFFSANWFYNYHFNAVNLAKFDTRTRSLNGVLYWSAQIVGAFIFGYALDIKSVRRSVKAKILWGVLLGLTMVIWGGGYDFQRGYTRAIVNAPGYVKLDWTSNGYIGPMFLYIFYGMYDAIWQTSIYWYIGSLSNNSRKIANLAGFYKGLQSAGSVITWRIDLNGTPYMTELASCWALLSGSLLIAAPVIFLRVKDHVALEDDLKLSDESAADVVPQAVVSHAVLGEKILESA